jgi:hypothetical protein
MTNLLSRGNTDFRTSASKFFGYKSSQLDAVITALEAYQGGASQTRMNTLLTNLMEWFRLNPKEIKAVNRGSRARELLQEMLEESNTRGYGLDMRTAGWQPSAITLIGSVLDELNKCKGFVCSDAAQFAGDINPAIPRTQQALILQRAQEHGQGTGLAEIPRHDRAAGDWNASSIATACERVYTQEAGECTSFGKAAAHLLSTASMTPFMPRVEVVAFSQAQQRPRYNRDGSPLMVQRPGSPGPVHAMLNIKIAHVFCVVGRQGTITGTTMPHPSTWNAEARIVDCWLGSLGYECVFTVAGYPKPGYFTNLELVMDSYQGADAVF